MKGLDGIVAQYIGMDTDYALMITGEWGTGKTYYYKNVLTKMIGETPVFSNNSKNYNSISVSLFGLGTIEQIQTEILISLYPILKHKAVKLSLSAGKSLIKGIMQIKHLGGIYKEISEIEVDKKDWINFEELVICFDDLERKSPNLDMEELIGYINTLVENENAKVIIIANENRIEDSKFKELKEKVIKNTVEYIPNEGEIYDSIVENRFQGFSEYQTFLKESKLFIIDNFFKNTKNVRILVFALSYYHRIFSEFCNNVKGKDILEKRKDEILRQLLRFCLAVSIEYKQGRISFKMRKDLEKESLSISELFSKTYRKDKGKEEKSYREDFIQGYYFDVEYYYYNSVFEFLTGGSILLIDELMKELEHQYHLVNNTLPPHYEIMERLNPMNARTLSDEEYKALVNKMLEYVDAGKYEIIQSLTLFYYACNYNNPLKFNINKLKARIIKGMIKGKNSSKYNQVFSMQLDIPSEHPYKQQLLEIKQVVIELNKELEKEEELKYAKELEELYQSNWEEFMEKGLPNNGIFWYTPLLQYFSDYKFYLFFLRSDNKIRSEITNFIYKRYLTGPPSINLKNELSFLERLNKRVEGKCKSYKNGSISRYHINVLHTELSNSISKLKAY